MDTAEILVERGVWGNFLSWPSHPFEGTLFFIPEILFLPFISQSSS